MAGGVGTVIFDGITGGGGMIEVMGRTVLWELIGGESDAEIIEEGGGTTGIEGIVKEATNIVVRDAEVSCGGLCVDGVWPR